MVCVYVSLFLYLLFTELGHKLTQKYRERWENCFVSKQIFFFYSKYVCVRYSVVWSVFMCVCFFTFSVQNFVNLKIQGKVVGGKSELLCLKT